MPTRTHTPLRIEPSSRNDNGLSKSTPAPRNVADTPLVVRPGSGQLPLSQPQQHNPVETVEHVIIEQNREEIPASAHKPKKRKRDSDIALIEEKTAVELETLLSSIFEAEDHLEPDTSGNVSALASEIFAPWSRQGRPSLASSILISLAELFAKSRPCSVPVEQLVHVQRLALTSVTTARELDLSLTDSDGESFMIADNSLRASGVIVLVMLHAPEEKLLQSEDQLIELLNNMRNILDTTILPLLQKTVHFSEGHLLVGIAQRCGRLLKLFGEAALVVDLSETSTALIESVCMVLLFVENNLNEKESILGSRKIETMRRHAMDTIARIFLRNPEQRQYILDELLASLEKLPSTRQAARHFKLSTGKSIQLISALMMQLVQTSALPTKKRKREMNSDEDPDTVQRSEGQTTHDKLCQKKALVETAQGNAVYVMRYLVQRALNTTKTGDLPYRNLLDIFTEDFAAVFGMPVWPGAELLIRALLSHLFNLIESDKSTAPAKTMALELMAVVGSAIADIRAIASQQESDADDSIGIINFAQLCEESLDGVTLDSILLDPNGPYALLTEHLKRVKTSDGDTSSARGYVLGSWQFRLCTAKSFEATDPQVVRIAKHLLAEDVEFSCDPSPKDGRLCHALILLNLPVCKAFDRIWATMLACLTSQQATVRTRSIRSVTQLLEQDASVLDRSSTVLAQLLRCASDESALVRDAAMTLVGRCMVLRPSMEMKALTMFVERATDTAVAVRKRSIKSMRDVYLKSNNQDVKATIADAILLRLSDLEESVAELAHQAIDEMWFTPFHNVAADTAEWRSKMVKHTNMIVAAAQRSENTKILALLFKKMLKETVKNSAANRKVCQTILNVLFDWIIDNDAQEHPNQRLCLVTLAVFAHTDPRLFTSDQMETLRPYIENLNSYEDLVVYRSVVTIYRLVLPVLPPMKKDFLLEVQDVLFGTVQKLGKSELEQVSQCLWIIDGVVKNTERLVKLMASVIRGIQSLRGKDLVNGQDAVRFPKYIMLAGHFGKACNFDKQLAIFRQAFPTFKFVNVSQLVIDTMLPFTTREKPLSIRECTLEAIGLVCQAWPKGYQSINTSSAMRSAFQEREDRLVSVVLESIRSFYTEEEARSKAVLEENSISGAERLGKSMVLSDNDGASTAIANQFLPEILNVALGGVNDNAVTATEIIASINRQGLVHPKEIGSALVALEMSPHETIAKIAIDEHRDMHAKHESMLDKQYLNAVEHAYTYLEKVVCDTSAVVNGNLRLQPFFEVLKTGSVASRKKFLGGLCMRIESDINKLQADDKKSILFAAFLLVSLGMFDYARVDEVLLLLAALEKIFATIGGTVAQHLEQSDDGQYPTLLAKSVILTMIWTTRTHLRRAWGLIEGKKTKDITKAPTRSGAANSADFVARMTSISGASEVDGMQQARDFINLVAVDQDKEHDSADDRQKTPSEDDSDRQTSIPPSSGKGRKRRKSSSANGTPQKAAKFARRPSVDGRRRSVSVRLEAVSGSAIDADGDYD